MTNGSGGRPKQKRGEATSSEVIRGASEVFARKAFTDASLRDISEASGVSPGSMYHHFGNKDDIARAVLQAQQELMQEVRERACASEGSALDKLLATIAALGALISSSSVVQAGIRLAHQPQTGLEVAGGANYADWVLVARELIEQGVRDGSIRPDVDASAMAQTLNELFVGAQTLSGSESQWKTLPERLERGTIVVAWRLLASVEA